MICVGIKHDLCQEMMAGKLQQEGLNQRILIQLAIILPQ